MTSRSQELEDILTTARDNELNLSPSDVLWDNAYGWTIDGMDAHEWIQDMTME
jgi:hypothetical protein